MLLALLVLAAASTSWASQARFDNYEVFRIMPQSKDQIELLRQIEEQVADLNFWTEASMVGHPVDIMVPPYLKADFDDIVRMNGLVVERIIDNVQQLIDRQMPRNLTKVMNWRDYQPLDEIYEWLEMLEAEYYGIVSVVVGGESYEGRPILGVKISYKLGNKIVFVEGGIHAREWISTATVTYIINQLLTSNDPDVREIAENHDWYIFPSVNPDGYVYTHTSNRVWRKTRKPYGNCFGADPNRNWGYRWNEGGTSNNPCLDTFCGSEPFSEIETASLAGFISSVANNIEIYLSFHSYSQLLLIPFGHSGLEVPENNYELHVVGQNAVAKLAERYGTQYKVGNIPEVIYVASGGSSDWVLGTNRHIRWVYTYELRDTGFYGFLLPPEQIIPTGEETLDSVVSIVQQAKAARK